MSAARMTGGGRALTAESLAGLLGSYEGSDVTLCSRVRLADTVVDRVRECVNVAAARELQLEVRVVPTMDAGAVLYVGDIGRVVLDPRTMWLSAVERDIRQQIEQGQVLDGGDAYQYLHAEFSESGPAAAVEGLLDTGRVLRVGDGVAQVAGLRDVGSYEVVAFEGGVRGLALALKRDTVGVVLLGDERLVREGSDARRTGHLLRVPAGDGMLGRVVDPIGNPMDEGGTIVPAEWMPVERAAPRVVDRQPVCVPLYTGMKVIDALVPIGRGQRELIIGDRGLGKTSIGVDTILAQKGRDVSCVYCAIGQKASTVREVVATFERFGALEYTAIVVALPDDPPSMRYLAPYCACAMAEYFMYRGGDALVVLDDLSKHAVTYREISALLERPVGREAYPGDIFYLHSRLLERAAHLAAGAGGGSLTAIPIVETLAGDISAYIPTNVISICDGQIVLDAAAFNEGSRPALDAGLSVSRVGGSAQVAALRRVAGRLRIDLAQYEEMARFVKFGAEVDAATRAQLRRGARARELLKQPVHRPMSPVEEVAVLFAVTSGLLDKVAVSAIARAEEMLLEWVASGRSKTLAALAQSGEMDADTEAVLADEIGALIASAALETVDETSDAMVNV